MRPQQIPTTSRSPYTHLAPLLVQPLAQQEELFEYLVADLSSTFSNLSASKTDSILESMQRIATFFQVDQLALGEVCEAQHRAVLKYSYAVSATPAALLFNEEFPWWLEQVRHGEVIRGAWLPDDFPMEARKERRFCVREGIKAHLMIPLTVRGAQFVLTCTSYSAYHEWSDQVVQRMRLLGEMMANAFTRLHVDEVLRAQERSLDQAQEKLRNLAGKMLHAQEEERRRLAREMHDDWTQRLALLSINIAKLETQLDVSEKALPLLRATQKELVGLSEDVHSMSRQLHPSILDDLGLVDALRSECASFSRREKIAVVYRAEKVPPIAKNVALCFYRTVQEALRNLAKHAAIDKAWVSLTGTASELVLHIEDKGVGFDVAQVRAEPGLGLTSMEERATLIQAKLLIKSVLGRGTIIEVRVPLTRSQP